MSRVLKRLFGKRLTRREVPALTTGNPPENQPAYPHFVIRWMGAVFGYRAVEFVSDESHRQASDAYLSSALVVVDPQPFHEQVLTASARQRVLEAAQHVLLHELCGLHIGCVVFGEHDCVYINERGEPQPHTDPPRGGIRIDHIHQVVQH